MSLALYRKYRPQTFKGITNQNHVKITLEGEVATGKVAHAYLFSGPRGTGKTSIARIFSKAVNCQKRKGGEPCNTCEGCTTITEGRALDVIEIDAASYTGVDNVRETIVETAKFAPTRLKFKVFIIDEAHMLSTSAWNALLKIMEEPPAHVIFVLATTEVHKVPATILSRCQRFDFHRIKPLDMVARLKYICGEEKVTVAIPVLQTVARLSEGCVRDAESLLEQLLSLGEKEVTEEVAALVLPRTSLPAVLDFLEVLWARETVSGLTLLNRYQDEGIELQQFTADCLEILRNILLLKTGAGDIASAALDEQTRSRISELAGRESVGRILTLIDLLVRAKQQMKTTTILQLPLEIAVVEGCGEGSQSDPQPQLAQKTHSVPPAREPVLGAQPRSSANGGSHARSASAALLLRAAVADQTLSEKKEAGLRVSSAESPPNLLGMDKVKLTLEEIKAKWPEVLKRVQAENHSLPFLLSTSVPLSIEGDTVNVGVQYSFHSDKLNEPKCRGVLEKIVEEIYNLPLKVAGVVHLPERQSTEAVDDILSTLGGRVVE